MGSASSTAAAEFERCMRAERRAWNAVAGRIPGSLNHDREAWSTWVERVRRSDVARQRVQSEILRPPMQGASPVHGSVPDESVSELPDEDAEEAPFVPSRPVPLSEAHETNVRVMAMARAAGLQWSHFQTTLLRLGPGALSGANYIVTVTCARLGLSRTYDAEHESGWLDDFQQDLDEGIFSGTKFHAETFPAARQPDDLEHTQ